MTAFAQDLDPITPGSIALLGVPFDANSSYLRGPASAPPMIREALRSESANMCAEDGTDLGVAAGWQDVGDLDLPDDSSASEMIEQAVNSILEKEARVVTLGGDHSITYPIIRAYAQHYDRLTILQLDAHPDLYDELDGNRFSHATPFARIMEEGLVERVVQVGIRTMTPHQRTQADRFGVEVHDMCEDLVLRQSLEGPVYLTLDIDCLDPAFAPGVSHYEPGGMSTRDVIGIIQNLKGQLVGADVVEFNPARDPQGITAMVAAKLTKEILARMLA